MENERRAPHPMLVDIHGDLRVVMDRQENMYERLFGNGQPGELYYLAKKIEAVETSAHSKIAAVEERIEIVVRWKWWMAGAAAAIGVASGLVYKFVLKL